MILKKIRTAFISIFLLTMILGIAYPLLICVVGRLFFPNHANGSLIHGSSGQIIGSKNIGQNFLTPQYFHPRPSFAGTNGYDAMASQGSNLGPTSKKLIDLLGKRIEAYRQENNLSPSTAIPADAVTASASGLDPHISYHNAMLQAPRVSQARNIPQSQITGMIQSATTNRWLGVFGEPSVNVLLLNIHLDAMKKEQ